MHTPTIHAVQNFKREIFGNDTRVSNPRSMKKGKNEEVWQCRKKRTG